MAAPLVDTANGATGTNTSYSIPLTIAANSNRVLYVFVQDPNQVGGLSVVWNTSETVTQIGTGTVNTNDDWYVFRLIAPTAGSFNVVVSSTSGPHTVIALAVYDCDQTTPNDAIDAASGSGTAATNTVTSEVGDLAICFGASTGTSTWAEASGETEIYDTAASGAIYSLAGAASVSFDATLGTSRPWMFIGLNLNAVGGAATEQEGFRWRADDGNETTASWLAAQDANITRAVSTNTRLRVIIATTGDAPSQAYTLQYRKVGDPASEWENV